MGIQHELGQGTVQTGDAALHHGKTRAAQLGRGIEIQAQTGTDVHMILDFEFEDRRLTHFSHFDIARFIGAQRNGRMRQVGHRFQELAQRSLYFIEPGGGRLQFVAYAGHFGHDRGRILALAFQYADLLGQAVATALQFLGAGLDLLALGFQRVEGSYIKLKLARCQALGNGGDIFA
jgi:hypothetical protein